MFTKLRVIFKNNHTRAAAFVVILSLVQVSMAPKRLLFSSYRGLSNTALSTGI